MKIHAASGVISQRSWGLGQDLQDHSGPHANPWAKEDDPQVEELGFDK